MNWNVSINSKTSTGSKTKIKRELTAQEEYWLNRILRDHSSQIFIIIALFLALLLTTVVYGIRAGNNPGKSTDFSLIQINP